MDETGRKLIQFLSDKAADCVKEEEKLIREERKDEANLCKIKANIYDIFRVLYQTAQKQAMARSESENECLQQIHMNFTQKAGRIPLNWKESYKMAKEHQDAQKILIEETKLAVADEIMLTYQQIRGEA